MEHTATSPSPSFSSFAGLLARLADATDRSGADLEQDGLADDVAHIRFDSVLAGQQGVPLGDEEMESAEPIEETGPAPVAAGAPQSRERRYASVTVRMRQAESEQIRERAAEAGMTVSAYLRSCVFEVEGLRAQVKRAVAEMKVAVPVEQEAEARRSRHARRIWPFGRA